MSISGSSPGPPGAHQEHQRLPGRDPGGQRAGISDGARKREFRGLIKCLETLRESRSLKRLEI